MYTRRLPGCNRCLSDIGTAFRSWHQKCPLGSEARICVRSIPDHIGIFHRHRCTRHLDYCIDTVDCNSVRRNRGDTVRSIWHRTSQLCRYTRQSSDRIRWRDPNRTLPAFRSLDRRSLWSTPAHNCHRRSRVCSGRSRCWVHTLRCLT